MLATHTVQGPTFAALRQLQEEAGEEGRNLFPVYPDLEKRLLEPEVDPASGEPDPVLSHVLAAASAHAYSDAATMVEMMTRLGLEECRCREVAVVNDAMLVTSTAYLLQSRDGRVAVLAYRGTEPVNPVSWLTDLDATPVKVRLDVGGGEPFAVHPGFYRNVRATRYEVARALRRALDGEPVDGGTDRLAPLEALYVTGHSLGGAMAAILGLLLRLDPAYDGAFDEVLRAVYTFGQPMVGDPLLAGWADADPDLGGRLFRFVYEGDPVPALPPRDTGRWAHFGHERHHLTRLWGAEWRTVPGGTGQARFAGQLALALASLPLTQLVVLQRVPFLYRIDDHRPQHYVAMLTPQGRLSEFGDHEVRFPQPWLTRLRRQVEEWGRRVTQAGSGGGPAVR